MLRSFSRPSIVHYMLRDKYVVSTKPNSLWPLARQACRGREVVFYDQAWGAGLGRRSGLPWPW